MGDLMKASVDASELGDLEQQMPKTDKKDTFATFDEYEKHQKAAEKEIVTTTTGSYVMGDIIGKGGFATVCKGLNLATGEVVAVKKFERSKISTQQISSVMYEVELLQRLTHDNIVHILGKAEGEKHLYIFMEYMENGSMRGLLQSFGAFPEQLVSQFMEQVLHGLIYLHDAGVIHRDIKAANILLNRSDVKLADFGVAAELNENDRRYSVVGTPYWMAPEVIEITGHSLASDIWSIGCTVIEMVTGKPPYFHLNPMSAMFRIVQDPFPPLPKGISKDLESFLKSCFQKEPEYRLSARELLVHPWITQRQSTPLATTHEDIRKSVHLMLGSDDTPAEPTANGGSDESRENTIVHRPRSDATSGALAAKDHKAPDSPQADRKSNGELSRTSSTSSNGVPARSVSFAPERSVSFASDLSRTDSTRENSIAEDCTECARLHRLLAEERSKRQEILLTAINYIASSDAARAGQEADQQREFRESLRTQLEEEFKLAFPDDNMPRFMQRRLTISADQLPYIPPPDETKKDKDKKGKKEDKKEKEKKEKEKEKKEKEEKKIKKDKDSFTSSKEKKDAAMKELKEKKEHALKERRDMSTKEKEKEKEKESAKKDKPDKSWFSGRRKPSNTSSANLHSLVGTAVGD